MGVKHLIAIIMVSLGNTWILETDMANDSFVDLSTVIKSDVTQVSVT